MSDLCETPKARVNTVEEPAFRPAAATTLCLGLQPRLLRSGAKARQEEGCDSLA